jgi:hypothetical protein
MLHDLWNRLVGRTDEELIEDEQEREQMSPAEQRRFAESVDDLQADESAGEHLGGLPADELAGEDAPGHSF